MENCAKILVSYVAAVALLASENLYIVGFTYSSLVRRYASQAFASPT
jgi:hypothetical protein